MQFKLSRVILLAVLLLGGLSAAIAVAPSGRVTVALRFLADDNRTELDALPRADFRIVFAFIGGAIYGNPTSETVVEAYPTEKYTFALDLDELSNSAKRKSIQATSQMLGLAIEPASAQFARIGTFIMDPMLQKALGATGWIDGDTKEVMVLVHFDEPCRIKGRLLEDGHEYRYDVSVPRAGLSWFRYKRTGERGTDIVLSTWPSNLQLSFTPKK